MLKVTRRKVAVLVGAALLALSLLFSSPSTSLFAGDCPTIGSPPC